MGSIGILCSTRNKILAAYHSKSNAVKSSIKIRILIYANIVGLRKSHGTTSNSLEAARSAQFFVTLSFHVKFSV